MRKAVEDIFIGLKNSVLAAMKQMDQAKTKLLIVQKENKYFALLSIGDIQRAIINNCSLNDEVQTITRQDYIVAKPCFNIDEIKALMIKIRAEFMPVVDDNSNLVNVYFWEDLFGDEQKTPLFRFNLPVVVMAGGMGTRLRPLTNVLPKPLIPINDKTLIEEIFERFTNHGCDRFFVSLNYKANLIEYYLHEQHLPYNVTYFKETMPLGTAGSLSLLNGKIEETFFVSNCDILIDQDYSEILDYHRKCGNDITIVAALKHFPISYGTLETGINGKLNSLNEKPELILKINSGMYILEAHVINDVPEDTYFHITDLIEKYRLDGRKVGVFPVAQNSWQDIGEWNDYLSHIKRI